MKLETAATLLNAVTGGCTPQRLHKMTTTHEVITSKPDMMRPGTWTWAIISIPETAELVECADEKTGVRFGQAKCRAGHCLKIGSGGRNKGQAHAYQIWAVWE
jgi:hypothetical protein